MKTLYQLADEEIRACIGEYLHLMEVSGGLSTLDSNHLDTARKIAMVLAGLNVRPAGQDAHEAVAEWERRRAVPFDAEAGITAGVYVNLRAAGVEYLAAVKSETRSFTNWPADFIRKNPHTLPILQHLAGIFSKAALKKQIGSASDTGISGPAAARIAELLTQRVKAEDVREGEILSRLESTLEGIVRDLVGRVMLESIVENALKRAAVPYKKESEYPALTGVVYDFRADFVVPDEKRPSAFIEVRKSSSRHASLYAKDKMFSAINWKGKHHNMIAVLVVDGEWTAETLRVMANVFDYVIPLSHVNDPAHTLASYLAGDATKLKWLVSFSIEQAGGRFKGA